MGISLLHRENETRHHEQDFVRVQRSCVEDHTSGPRTGPHPPTTRPSQDQITRQEQPLAWAFLTGTMTTPGISCRPPKTEGHRAATPSETRPRSPQEEWQRPRVLQRPQGPKLEAAQVDTPTFLVSRDQQAPAQPPDGPGDRQASGASSGTAGNYDLLCDLFLLPGTQSP